jgi:hypothetical protein
MLTGILIGAAVLGGILKVGSRHINDKKEKERLEQEEAEDLQQLDKQWEIAQKEAFEQADKLKLEADRLKEDSIEADALTDISENIISQTFNAAIDDISMQEKQNAIQLQNEMIGTEAGLSNMEVASGASGIRAGSGTNSDVIAQQKELAQRNREQEQIILDQSFQNSLMQVGLGLQQDKINVRGNRLQANRLMENSELTAKASADLRASYSSMGEGDNFFEKRENAGDAYKAYYMKRNDLMTDYENAIQETKFDWMEFGSDLLTGASAGYKFATNMIKLFSSTKDPSASAK